MDTMSMQPSLSFSQGQLDSSPPSRFPENSQQPLLADAGVPTQASQNLPEPAQPRSAEQMADIINQLNEQLTIRGMSIRFGVDELSNRNFFSIEDSVSGEQLRQIPAEEILNVSRSLSQFLETNVYARMGQTESSFAPGLLTDQQA